MDKPKTELEKFIESLTPAQKAFLDTKDKKSEAFELTQEEIVAVTYRSILSLGVAGDQLSEPEADRLYNDFRSSSNP